MRIACTILIILLIVSISCKREVISSSLPVPYQLNVPANFPVLPVHSDNPLTNEGVELGRRLFYDKRLSGNNMVSCASCHQQNLAFSDGTALTAAGVSGMSLRRNAPALINLAWLDDGFFWDGAAPNLEAQAFMPLANPDEMHQLIPGLISELKAIPDYVQRFRSAFNSDITDAAIAKAIAQFQRSLVSANSKYDKYRRNEPGGIYNSEERRGMELVQIKCGGCHAGELLTDNIFHNNGLDSSFTNTSFDRIFLGRYRITNNPADIGKFKTPTLRNILLTAPYMHDGRFATIDQVFDHYATGIKNSATLDPLVKQDNGNPGIPLSAVERQAILVFLQTLTDNVFITNPKFSNPF